MSEVVGLSKPSSGALDYAIELLFTAAKSGSTSDIAAATDEIERLLRDQRLLAESRAELVVDV